MLHSKELHPLGMWLVPLSYSRSPSYGFVLKDLMCIKAQGNIICCFRQSSLFYRTTHSQTSARVSLWHRMSSMYPSQWQNVFLFCFFFSTYLTVAWCLAQSRLGTKVSWGKGIAVKDIKHFYHWTVKMVSIVIWYVWANSPTAHIGVCSVAAHPFVSVMNPVWKNLLTVKRSPVEPVSRRLHRRGDADSNRCKGKVL